MTVGALAGAVMAGCGSAGSATPYASSSADIADLQIARMGAGLEALAMTTYDAILSATTAGTLGPVPAAFSLLVNRLKGQHAEHRDSWNALLTQNSRPAQTEPDAGLIRGVREDLSRAASVMDVARLALRVESITLQSYVAGAQATRDRNARRISLTIAPVEAEHTAILSLVLGRYPVPDVQVKRDMARSTVGGRA
ncbi:MAG: ferritin-like domain-containing protein [Candidatus Dormibacteria bacterium]